jgi:transposase InsO family protein
MPWKETGVVNLRTEFVLKTYSGKGTFEELCGEYGISRKTGYKWKERFLAEGVAGLADQSRRPQRSPSQASEDLVCELVRLKQAHRSWGPRKIRVLYGRLHPELALPSESTCKRILEKAGLVTPRRGRAQATSGRLTQRLTAERANQVWTVDFKGWWRTGDHRRFEPLTVRDAYSRYILSARALVEGGGAAVRVEFERLFAQQGLPEVIRSDNGSPFACTRAPWGLSRLSAWWLTLGIDLDRIPPGRPDQNGAHERMHRDLALEVEGSSSGDVVAQQVALDVWRRTYNDERPHEALGMRVPAELYRPSPRQYDAGQVCVDYPLGYLRRRVTSNGALRLHGVKVQISEALCGHEVGLEPHGERYALWFCRLRLGEIDVALEKFYASANGGASCASAATEPSELESSLPRERADE